MVELAFIFAIILFLYYIPRSSPTRNLEKEMPPVAAGKWPLIGHLHLLGGPKLPHIVLAALADKYGPIFTIKLGVRQALVVSNWETAKECYTKNDTSFCNRPRLIAFEHMGYNYASFIFSPYGPYWTEMRRITAFNLLANHRIPSLSHLKESVVKSFIKNIYEKCVYERSASDKAVFEMKRCFGDLSIEIIFQVVAGKSFKKLGKMGEGEQCRKALKDFVKLTGLVTVGDAVPFLRWFDFGGYEKKMKKVGKELDMVLSGWLEEHKKEKVSGEFKEDQDFMDIMLSIIDDSTCKEQNWDADTIIKSTCLVLVLGASDSTKVTLTWALTLLLNNPWALKKVQAELDMFVGTERTLTDSDVKHLPYLQAIVKETLRLQPASQLLFPRESIKDCYVGGYHIPAGTRLIVNVWKMHRDPRVWPDSLEFKPERFLTTHREFDVRGQNFELLPFGSGRRVCPGISFALQTLQLTLGSLLHSFEIETASGDEFVDMTEEFGLTNIKATPLEVVLTPRLPAELYA